ncbi:hypothetical protein KGM_210691 [Danaus plexippus plexippus]|uniref:Protein zwilch n=1 Tax=Danaus plexippus plexippus TaxID=278856 RepID=A0A212F135_DANPL|nr:hypothetical protein KGM_210691 [Danaus plexippus plexippus]
MEKLIQPVKEVYSKFVFDKQTPSYVEIYTKNETEAVIVYSKAKLTPASTLQVTNENNKSEELDLTGSPLKLDLSLHTILDETFVNDEPQLWRKEEAQHAPIDIDTAREILNSYNQITNKVTAENAIPMWVLCKPSETTRTLLMTIQSNENQFDRGLVTYEGSMSLDEIDVDEMVSKFSELDRRDESDVSISVECKYAISGVSYSSYTSEEQLIAPHGGLTELTCQWSNKTLLTPFISCSVHFVQEVIIGHIASPCNAIWKSVCALHNINQLLVEMTSAGVTNIPLDKAFIRINNPNIKQPNNSKRLTELLNETEMYTYTAECPVGGCICVTEDTTSLRQCMSVLSSQGSSNDFTYKLWDILRDCETAEELVTLLIQALKFISSGKIRPFIDVNNKSYLSKLVLKLSRGHSQTSKVLKNLKSSPPQALSLVGQVGIEKTMWEYTRIMSLLEHSFFIAGIWHSDTRSNESIEQINQTIQDMTMGDTLNPFENLTSTEHSIRLDTESVCIDDDNELTVDDFTSLKKHGLVNERKDINEVPLIADEIDISPWKNLLMKFAQVHVCLEHLYRAETCLRADFVQLKPMASKLLESYVSEKSSIKTVGQLMNEPIHNILIPITNNIVQDQLKKPAAWYRLELGFKEVSDVRNYKLVSVFSQLPAFPPQVWQHIEPPSDEVVETTTVEELKYHHTKYMFISDKYSRKLDFLM